MRKPADEMTNGILRACSFCVYHLENNRKSSERKRETLRKLTFR